MWVVTGLANTAYPVLIAAGQLLATVPIAFVLHALLAFPSGRLTTRPARVLAAGGYVVTTVLVGPQYLFSPLPPPYDPLFVADRPDVLAVLGPVITASTVALVLATAGVLVHRLVTGAPHTRRTLAPVYAYGAGAVVGGGCSRSWPHWASQRPFSRSCRSCCWRACRWRSWPGCCAAASPGPRSCRSWQRPWVETRGGGQIWAGRFPAPSASCSNGHPHGPCGPFGGAVGNCGGGTEEPCHW